MSILSALELDPQRLSQHVLIVGTTGSGKTQTTLGIIHELYIKHNIPFLVIESAKREYRGLLKAEQLKDKPIRIYTVGNETVSPFIVNPFQLLEGVRVEDHIRLLVNCFLAALPPDIGSLPAIIDTAIRAIYKDKGWYHNDTYCVGRPARFPTMIEFVNKVEEVINKEFARSDRIRSDVGSVLSTRLKLFTSGSRGYLFGLEVCHPDPRDLFANPTILEMDSLVGTDKALVSLFLLVFLWEHCRLRRLGAPLQHITVIEEAHNLLSRSDVANIETVANTRNEGVGAFCNMLSEIRAYGEGLIVVDQRPSKLASDAIANTNTKIIHRLIEQNDRTTIACSILAQQRDLERIGSFESGQVLFFTAGQPLAKNLQLPHYMEKDGMGYTPSVSDEEVRHHLMEKKLLETPYPEQGCSLCKSVCRYKQQVEELLSEIKDELQDIDLRKQGWMHMFKDFIDKLSQKERSSNDIKMKSTIPVDKAWCIIVHLLKMQAIQAPEEMLSRNRGLVERVFHTR